ncbi:NUDIX hydrolase [Magnetovibrio blakemorei]|uniref:Nudix hydrolase domain-containing protein n=1 Tax=Magnetovibrio blakemorei TaxID=28181 RepID=A0A1E5QC51_9PROT|nr:NUDIX hydrolase [Magnetovibrio blakemorei]OEJ69574.1 hypothetical protein BEN30_02545 [Magnetovibrio blakemorei]
MQDLKRAIKVIDTCVPNPRLGLGDEVFRMVSRLTPMVNVDLLIKNESGDILLTWRDDDFYGPGWHIPGGVLRFKETFDTRIQAVAKLELNTHVAHDSTPCMIQPSINRTHETRGHFVSLLFKCTLTSPLDDAQKFDPQKPQNNHWAWHPTLPENMIEVQHEIYNTLWDLPV